MQLLEEEGQALDAVTCTAAITVALAEHNLASKFMTYREGNCLRRITAAVCCGNQLSHAGPAMAATVLRFTPTIQGLP